MVIKQGDIYWIDLGYPSGSAPGFKHPHVVIQNNIYNESRIKTVVVCAVTSNLKRASAPGNVLLRKGEANLQKDCVVNVSQILTVDKSELTDKIGTLPHSRILQIVEGIDQIIQPKEL